MGDVSLVARLESFSEKADKVSRQNRTDWVGDFIDRFGSVMLGVARRYSARAADADDAYQRAAEVLLTRAPDTDDEERLVAWALTVVRNEALMIHRVNQRFDCRRIEELEELESPAACRPDERLIVAERLVNSHEALGRLKPDQMRCLLLCAEGFTYEEITRQTGLSFTKVNRYISDGRAALRSRVGSIESGAECRRFAGVLSMMADGVAQPEAEAEARKHLKNCLACQATLREYRTSPERVAALVPLGAVFQQFDPGVLARGTDMVRRLVDSGQSLLGSAQERIANTAAGLQSGGEIALSKKIVAVTLVSASLLGGGAAVESAIDSDEPNRETAPEAVAPREPVVGSDDAADDSGKTTNSAPVRQARAPRMSDEQGGESRVAAPARDETAQPRGDSADSPRSYERIPEVPLPDPVQEPFLEPEGDVSTGEIAP